MEKKMIFEHIISVFVPVMIHYMVSIVVQSIGQGKGDAAFLTTVAAAATLPVFIWMKWKDIQRYGGNGMNTVRPMTASGCLVIIIGAVAANEMLGFLVQLLVRGRVSNAAQESLFGSSLLMQILGVGILIPLMEEVLFRGLLYTRLKRFLSPRIAVLLGALIFAVYHGNLIQFLFAFPMGLLLLLVYERWGTLKAPVLFHMTVNLSSVLLTAFL